MTFKAPTLTDEDNHYQHMPGNMQCESCVGIVFQVFGELKTVVVQLYKLVVLYLY